MPGKGCTDTICGRERLEEAACGCYRFLVGETDRLLGDGVRCEGTFGEGYDSCPRRAVTLGHVLAA